MSTGKKPKTGVAEFEKLLEGSAQLLPGKVNLATTALMLEKLHAAPEPDEDGLTMYVFDKDGNKVTL